jgi:hypothetical protein
MKSELDSKTHKRLNDRFEQSDYDPWTVASCVFLIRKIRRRGLFGKYQLLARSHCPYKTGSDGRWKPVFVLQSWDRTYAKAIEKLRAQVAAWRHVA